MATGAATDLANTAIQCVHVHTAPILDTDAKRLLAEVENPPAYYDPAFLERAATDLADAVQGALARLESCNRIGVSQAKVDQVASNRRIMVNGKIHWRSSSGGRDPVRRRSQGDDPNTDGIGWIDQRMCLPAACNCALPLLNRNAADRVAPVQQARFARFRRRANLALWPNVYALGTTANHLAT